MRRRMILLMSLLVLGSSLPGTTQGKSKKGSKSAAECTPFAYDNGPVGQSTWCGGCNDGSVKFQAPINIPTNIPPSEQPVIQFQQYNDPTELVIYHGNPYNLKIDYKAGTSSIKIGNDTFKLNEFHFHRPSEEAVDNHRYPMVVHLVHQKAGCPAGNAGCVAAVAILIEQGEPSQKTNELLNILLQHFPPPDGPQPGVKITVEGLLPPNSDNAGYYRYDGSLTTPPCTGNLTFYMLKEHLKFSAEQLAQFEKHYPSPNARDIQPLNGRAIKNRLP